MTPEDIDLVYWEQSGERKMMAVCFTGDWHSSETPAKGAIGPLAAAVVAQYPTLFATPKDAEGFLMIRHFQNMSRHQNSAGQEYPYQIG